jgi:hypothetical protein
MAYDFNPQKRAIAWSLWQVELLNYAVGFFQGSQGRDGAPDRTWRLFGLRQKQTEESLLNEFLVAVCGLFDPEFYRAATGSTTSRGALKHFVKHGSEGLSPGPQFDGQRYLDRYPDVKLAGANPLLHFIRYGVAEGRWDALNVDLPPPLHPLSSDHNAFRGGPERGRAARSRQEGDATLVGLSESARASGERSRRLIDDSFNERAQLEVDLYGARSDFQRATIHNDRLMRDLATRLESSSSESIGELNARIAGMAETIAALRDDSVEADLELVRWRERAETAERKVRELAERVGNS